MLLLKDDLVKELFLEEIDNPLLSPTETQWQSVNELDELPRPLYTVTKRLQTEDLTADGFLFE